MKKNIFLRIALLALVFTLSTCGIFMGSGTAAKYYATANVKAEGTVALFDVRVNNGTDNIAAAGTVIADANLGALWEEDFVALENVKKDPGSADTGLTTLHVSPATGTILAPGTGSKNAVTVTNLSEVAVDVWISAGSGGNTPSTKIVFSGNLGTDWDATLADAMTKAIDSPKLPDGTTAYPAAKVNTTTHKVRLDPAGGTNCTVVFPLWWKWPFANNDGNASTDGSDTYLGVNASAKLTIPVVVNVEQVD